MGAPASFRGGVKGAAALGGAMPEDRTSICSYCGCGCRLVFQVDGQRVVKVRPDREDPVSQGRPCIKGLTLHEVADAGRVLEPLARDGKDAPLRPVTWDEALRRVREAFEALAPADVFVNASGKVTNEDAYATGKFARGVLQTPHLDACCTRLCHAATLEAMKDCLGSGATPHTMDDVGTCDVILIVGSNPASNYPVLFHRLVDAKRRGTRIAAVQALLSTTTRYADLTLLIRPATELALLNGLLRRLIRRGTLAPGARQLEGFAALERTVEAYDEAFVARVCGVAPEAFGELADLVGGAGSLGLIHGMGMTQHVSSVESVQALLDLLLLKEGKLLSNRGEINVQGVGDVGCLPDRLPTGPMATVADLEAAWGCAVPAGRGKTITEAFLLDPPRAALISGFNPARSLPNLNAVHANLRRMFLVALEHHHTPTLDFADVVLPTPTLWERRGTITTGERRVRRVDPVRDPPGEARPEWRIFQDLARAMGKGSLFPYRDPGEITEEILRVVPAYRGVRPEALATRGDDFADKRTPHRRLVPAEFGGVVALTSARHPMLLTSFRSAYQFLTGEATTRSPTLARFPDGPWCYLNPGDAARLGIADGARVRVESAVDALECPARIAAQVPPGVAGMHFHFPELPMNKLFPTQFDPRSFTPNFKVVAVRIAPVAPLGEAPAATPSAAPGREAPVPRATAPVAGPAGNLQGGPWGPPGEPDGDGRPGLR